MAMAATWLGGVQHVVGAPVIGMFLGMLLSNLAGATITARFKAGAAFASKTILRLGIILAGGTLSFATIVGAGGSALPYIIISIGFAVLTACLIGKYLLKVSPKTRVLVAGGTSICGGTAIATLSAVVEADEDETAYAMTAIFLFDILATLMWPYVALGLDLGPQKFSILAGIAINDVASVTAAGATYDALLGEGAEPAPKTVYVSAYEPAYFNVTVIGDQVWVEPKYVSSLYGTWGSSVRELLDRLVQRKLRSGAQWSRRSPCSSWDFWLWPSSIL